MRLPEEELGPSSVQVGRRRGGACDGGVVSVASQGRVERLGLGREMELGRGCCNQEGRELGPAGDPQGQA